MAEHYFNRIEYHNGRKHRLYEVLVTPSPSPEGWLLEWRWGRLGYPGQIRKSFHASFDDALEAARLACSSKVQGGYRAPAVLPTDEYSLSPQLHPGKLAVVEDFDIELGEPTFAVQFQQFVKAGEP